MSNSLGDGPKISYSRKFCMVTGCKEVERISRGTSQATFFGKVAAYKMVVSKAEVALTVKVQ